MTVHGEDVAIPGAEPSALFTHLYATYWTRVMRYIWTRLNVGQQPLAEDLAQETFIRFWSSYVSKGKLEAPEKCFTLLATIARGAMARHFDRHHKPEVAFDFEDPANRAVFPVKHSYALGSPHLAGLVNELDDAMEHMTAASVSWRAKHSETYKLRSRLSDTFHARKGGITTARRQQIEAEAQAADAEETVLLEQFRNACRTVGQLRAQLESVAGPGWRNTVQPPASQGENRDKTGSIRSDLTLTHCAAGHPLTLPNLSFTEDGIRRCRPCGLASTQASKAAKRQAPSTSSRTVPDDALDQIRQALEDPANDHLDLKQMVKMLGISTSVVQTRLTEVARRRHARRESRPAHVKNPKLATARALLLDPDCTLPLRDIAQAAGVSEALLYKRLAAEVAARAARRTAERAGAAR